MIRYFCDFDLDRLHLLYCSLIVQRCILQWGDNYVRIYKLLRRAFRIITGSKYNAHTEHSLKQQITYKLQAFLNYNYLNLFTNFSILFYSHIPLILHLHYCEARNNNIRRQQENEFQQNVTFGFIKKKGK